MSVSWAFFFGLLVLFTSDFGSAEPMYKKVGGSVVLDPGHESSPITSVTWKHKADFAVEMFEGEITFYRTFEGRCDLDKTTGRFTIRRLTLEDSGEYTPEINNMVLSKKELKVIKPVPKPTVSGVCNKEETFCDLTCEAQIDPAEFGPVTYNWTTGDKELSTNKEQRIMKNEKPVFCMLINPVSNSISDEFSDHISEENNIAAVVIPAVVICVLLLVGLLGVGVMWKRDPRVRAMWPFKYLSKNQDNATPGEGQNLLPVPQTTAENNSKGKEAPNGVLPANTNEDEISNVIYTVVSIEQNPPTEQVSDDEGESGQNSKSEETEPTAEGPEINNVNHTVVSMEQNPSTEQVSDNEGEPGQNFKSVETEPTDEGPETNQDQAAVTPNGGFHPVSQENVSIEQNPSTEQVSDDEGESGQNSKSEETEPTAEGPEKPKDSTCDPSVDTQPEQGSSQESNLDPSAGSPEPSSQTETSEETPDTDPAES